MDNLPAVQDLVGDQERATLSWLRAAAMEGMAILKREPAYNIIGKAMDYLDGKQLIVRGKTLSKITDNRMRKVWLETVSAMTDVRDVWDYRTKNLSYKAQAELITLLVRSWWDNQYCDLALQDALKFAGPGGSGYISPVWDPDLPGGGDIRLVVIDPRDVIPIRPPYPYVGSVQDWRGVLIRQRRTVNWLRKKYPHKAFKFGGRVESWFGDDNRSGSGTSVLTTLDVLFRSSPETGKSEAPYVDFIRAFIQDDSIHTGDAPRLMGKPGTNWSYVVYPVGSVNPVTGEKVTEEEARLYPRGRLILFTPDCVLEDIPNPYWHGQFPLIKITLDPSPWSLLGGSMIGDLIPLQDALNEVLRGIEDGVGRWLKPNVAADRTAVARSYMEKFDPRKGGQVLMTNPSGGDGVRLLEGPAPQVFATYFQVAEWLKREIDDNSGVMGLRQLDQLKQMPSPETIDKYMEAQSPLLRIRGRVLEQAIGELAEQVKVLVFQFYDVGRRVQIAGDEGVSLEDFDYDPNSLVPAMVPGEPGYLPELDASLSRADRAQHHHRNFSFYVTRNTMLTISHMQQKLLYLQLFRMGMLDPWTVWEAFDVANIGTPPKGTILERIAAAMQLGIMPGGAAPQQAGGGRPPTGQQPPTMVQKSGPDGPRTVVSESGR